MPIAGDHDVVRLEIPMNDARSVSLRQAFRDMLEISQKLSKIGLLSMNLFAQGLAVDKLHRDEVDIIALVDFVDVSNVRMIQGGGRLPLLNEAAHATLVSSERGRQDFERDFAIEAGVFGQINFTHPARAEFRQDAVMRDGCVGQKLFH